MVYEAGQLSTKCNHPNQTNNMHHLVDSRGHRDINMEKNVSEDQNHNKVILKKIDDKQLSFSNCDDYDTAEDSSSREEFQQKPVSKKWSSIIENGDLVDGQDGAKILDSSKRMTKTIVACETVEEDEEAVDNESNHDDASSTSSCSCEDHSSVVNDSEDPNETLDYDEDSITNSPAGASNTLTQDPSSASSIKDSSKIMSPSPQQSDNDLEDLTKEPRDSPRGSLYVDPQSKKSDQRELPRTRIRSFINFDHANERVSSIKSDKVDNQTNKEQKTYECLMRYFFKDACYFQIKSINHENVALSKSLGVWSTPHQNELRLNKAFQEHRNVILIFSVQQSGGFQGFARMISESRPSSKPVPWILPERLSRNSLGGVIKVQWLNTKELPFTETQDLFNPYNENKPVKVARDGQQVESKIGKKLCRLFPRDSRKTLLSSLSTLKQQTSQRKKMPHRREDLYPLANGRDQRYRDETGLVAMTIDEFHQRTLGIPGQVNNGYGVFNPNIRQSYRRRFPEPQGSMALRQYPSIHGNHFPIMRSYPMHRHQQFMPRALANQSRLPQGYQTESMYMPPFYQSDRFPMLYDPYLADGSTCRYHPYQRGRR